MLIDRSYFIGPLTIAQVEHKAVNDNLTVFINRHEPAVLQAALGYDLYSSFTDGLDVGSGEDIEQLWIDLRDGKSFTNTSNQPRVWNGFANNTTKLSAHAGFIYWEYFDDLASQVSGVGMTQTDAENAKVVSPMPKMIKAWNSSLKQIEVLWEFLEANKETYTDYNSSLINTGYFKGVRSSGYQNVFGI